MSKKKGGKPEPPVLVYLASSQFESDLEAFKKAMAPANGEVCHFLTLREATECIEKKPFVDIVVTRLGSKEDGSDAGFPLLKSARTKDKRTFVCVMSRTATDSALLRLAAFQEGANMVTASLSTVIGVIETLVAKPNPSAKQFKCPYCAMDWLSEDELCAHMPLFHINEKPLEAACPICKNSFPDIQEHVHHTHGPEGREKEKQKEKEKESRKLMIEGRNEKTISLYAFALVVCRRESDGKFLLVQEYGDLGYWLPGGKVDPGEDLKAAAIRETKEEAGIDVELTGILRIEYTPHHGRHRGDFVRMRVIFMAKPVPENQPAKTRPDFQSVGAVWTDLRMLKDKRIKLRGSEPLDWFPYVANNGLIMPISFLDKEGVSPTVGGAANKEKKEHHREAKDAKDGNNTKEKPKEEGKKDEQKKDDQKKDEQKKEELKKEDQKKQETPTAKPAEEPKKEDKKPEEKEKKSEEKEKEKAAEPKKE